LDWLWHRSVKAFVESSIESFKLVLISAHFPSQSTSDRIGLSFQLKGNRQPGSDEVGPGTIEALWDEDEAGVSGADASSTITLRAFSGGVDINIGEHADKSRIASQCRGVVTIDVH